MKKKIIFILSILLCVFVLQAKEKSENPLVGKWSQDVFGRSDYYLEFSDTELKIYNRKEKDEFISFSYTVYSDSEDTCFILSETQETKNNVLNEDWARQLNRVDGNRIYFTRKGSDLVLLFAAGNQSYVKSGSKKLKAVGGAVAGLAAVAGTVLLVSNASDNSSQNDNGEDSLDDIADKLIEAAKNF
ncbi:MAG: hypothetical protein K6C97_11285 [Treponema sp.]|nr:hypothetical protein [Treponema sp.]